MSPIQTTFNIPDLDSVVAWASEPTPRQTILQLKDRHGGSVFEIHGDIDHVERVLDEWLHQVVLLKAGGDHRFGHEDDPRSYF